MQRNKWRLLSPAFSYNKTHYLYCIYPEFSNAICFLQMQHCPDNIYYAVNYNPRRKTMNNLFHPPHAHSKVFPTHQPFWTWKGSWEHGSDRSVLRGGGGRDALFLRNNKSTFCRIHTQFVRFNPCSPESFSQTYFPKGGCCNPPGLSILKVI